MTSIDIGVVEQFLTPPLGVLTPHIDTSGPYSGNQTLSTWSSGVPVANTFGVIWRVNGAIPAELGYKLGWVDPLSINSGEEYEERLVQVVVQHQLLSGAWITTQIEDCYQTSGTIRWKDATPGRLGLYVLPGLAFDLYFLQVG